MPQALGWRFGARRARGRARARGRWRPQGPPGAPALRECSL